MNSEEAESGHSTDALNMGQSRKLPVD